MENLPCGSAPQASWEALSKPKSKISLKPAIASQSRVFCWSKNCFVPPPAGGAKSMNSKMKTTYKRVRTRFGPETRFELRPEPAAPFRALQESEFEKLKLQLLEERLSQDLDRPTNSYLRRAANEAASLAWVTPYPLLVFPALFEEKADAALLQARRQKDVRRRSLELLAL